MKISMSKMFLLVSMGMGTYMYLKKHPEKVCMMKKVGKDASRKMYQMLDEDIN